PPLPRQPVVLAVDVVVRALDELRRELLPVGDLARVDRLHEAARDEAVGGIARGRHEVVARVLLHEVVHLVRAAGLLLLDRAPRLLLERLHPLILDVALPVNDLERSPELVARGLRSRCDARGEQGGRRLCDDGDALLHPFSSLIRSVVMATALASFHTTCTGRPCAARTSVDVCERFCASTPSADPSSRRTT